MKNTFVIIEAYSSHMYDFFYIYFNNVLMRSLTYLSSDILCLPSSIKTTHHLQAPQTLKERLLCFLHVFGAIPFLSNTRVFYVDVGKLE